MDKNRERNELNAQEKKNYIRNRQSEKKRNHSNVMKKEISSQRFKIGHIYRLMIRKQQEPKIDLRKREKESNDMTTEKRSKYL